jgi:3-oxoacyl-(acyl-carrier-protein) synthase/SAM-dependent methyltransferase
MIDDKNELLQKSLTLIRQLKQRLNEFQVAAREPIAITGLSCRFPGGVDSLDTLFELLLEKRDAVVSVPEKRWKSSELPPDTRQAGLLDNVRGFDAEFFRIAPIEANSLDPQQRLLLEVGHEALEQAALPPSALKDTSTGVFVGIGGQDYYKMLANRDPALFDAYMLSGTSHSTAAGRLAFHLGLQGPAVALDTACSSSLVAAHLACQSLRNRECDVALVGGVNRILAPDYSLALSRSGMLSPECRCKVFAQDADGFVRAEGCAVLVLKRLTEAQRDHDRIFAVIRGTAINQDGQTSGLTVPNGTAQVGVIRKALQDAKVDSADVDFVEAHGTGTRLGDPIELRALQTAYGENRTSHLRVGSVKSNIGHCEATAGLAGLFKALLSVQRGQFLPNLHLEKASDHFPWDESKLQVVTEPESWSAARRLAGVSSFGFSGTNAHLIIEAPPAPVRESLPQSRETRELMVLSAKSPKSLEQLRGRYLSFLERSEDPWEQIAHTSRAGRDHYRFRVAIIAQSKSEAIKKLTEVTPTDIATASSRVDLQQIGQPWEDLQRAYLEGASIAWDRTKGTLVSLPTYCWQHEDYWFEDDGSDLDRILRAAHSAPTEPCRTPETLLEQLEQWVCQQAFRVRDLVPIDAIDSKYERLWVRLGELAARSSEPEIRFSSLLADSPESEVILHLTKRCVDSISSVIQGEMEPLEVLFSHAIYNLPELYRRSPGLKRVNQRLSTAVVEIAKQRGQVRILEVGGGTGSTTRYLLERLPKNQYQYVFTDVAQNLVAQAARDFQNYPLEARLLNLEEPQDEQSCYDLIIASNVIHATRDIAESLVRLRQLLKPSGWLVMLESTKPTGWVSLVSGLTDGWWRYTDLDLRSSSPLLDVPTWKRVLLDNGFASAGVVPGEDAETDLLAGQAVLIAQNDSAFKPEKAVSHDLGTPSSTWPGQSSNVDILSELEELPPKAREQRLQVFLGELLAEILGHRQSVDLSVGFCDLGIDSLTSVVFRNRLERALKVKLSGTLIYTYPTIPILARHLLEILDGEEPAGEKSIEEQLDQKLNSLEQLLSS